MSEQGVELPRIDALHFAKRVRNLGELEWAVVDEQECIESDVDVLRDSPHAFGFRLPVDSREEEGFLYSEVAKLRQRVLRRILACDRHQYSALVEPAKEL